MRAAEQGRTDIVRILLEHGADVNTKSDLGELHSIVVTLSNYSPIYISIYIYENQIVIVTEEYHYETQCITYNLCYSSFVKS